MNRTKTPRYSVIAFFMVLLALSFTTKGTGKTRLDSAEKFNIVASGDENRNKKNDTVEITEVDFAKAGTFNGNHATVFSIALGNGTNLVKQKIKNYTFLSLKEDAFNPKRFYLIDEGTKTSIAYLIWTNYDSALYQVVIYPAMSKYMKGLSAAIVSPDCVNKESDVYNSFLGEPTAKQVTLDNTKIQMKTTLMYYPKWNIVVEESKTSSGITYNMMFTHKWK